VIIDGVRRWRTRLGLPALVIGALFLAGAAGSGFIAASEATGQQRLAQEMEKEVVLGADVRIGKRTYRFGAPFDKLFPQVPSTLSPLRVARVMLTIPEGVPEFKGLGWHVNIWTHGEWKVPREDSRRVIRYVDDDITVQALPLTGSAAPLDIRIQNEVGAVLRDVIRKARGEGPAGDIRVETFEAPLPKL